MLEVPVRPATRTHRRRHRRARIAVVAALAAVLLGGTTFLSYYVDALWFASLGYGDVFWRTVGLQAALFTAFTLTTFLWLSGSYFALKPAHLDELAGGARFVVEGQTVTLPIEPLFRVVGLGVAIAMATVAGALMAGRWPTFGLYWFAPPGAAGAPDPIFGQPVTFYLFTLPAWQLLANWLTTMAFVGCAMAVLFLVVSGGLRVFAPGGADHPVSLRGLFAMVAFLLVMVAIQVYLGRYDRLVDDHTVFSGITYTDAHVMLTGALVVCLALLIGAGIATVGAASPGRARWLVAAVVPAVLTVAGVAILGWGVNSFIVKPNELVREQPYIAHNIEWTRRAYGLDRIAQRAFPADIGNDAVDQAHNEATLQNIRLWDWRALQDTLRQIQEIRTYYDFPDIDIDRYLVDGRIRQVMLATRELSVQKLPESSRNWINEKLVYTHGYGVTMNFVNGFTPEGMPTLILSNMPVQSTVAGLGVSRPEVYFGELTDTDVYVKTRQQEFNYPQGASNNLTSYEGTGGILLGGFVRRLAIALDRGDLAKLPFSDDVTPESRLLMRRNVRDRVAALAPFLTFDSDPYVVVGDDGRLSWLMDAFTTSNSYPYSRHYRLNQAPINYLRNSVKVAVDAYSGATTFYVFDGEDSIIAAYRRLFPSLFEDAAAMPPDLRRHVRYPELLIELQAAVYGLYHMTDPAVFYNREDLWTVATDVGMNQGGDRVAVPMEPNFVAMTLPGESGVEFVQILPFTPANRNNMIGWIAGRSDGEHYGTALVYNFPKTKLVDGPLQVEARIEQNAQLSGQLTLWNQQGSHVRRGSLLVIPIGRALLYAKSFYLQAERSPMPELRLVVLALQDRLAYGPTFEAAMAGLFGGAASSTVAAAAPVAAGATAGPPAAAPGPTGDPRTLIAEAAQDLKEYQRLTAEGRLGEAGKRLEALKQKLETLNAPRR